MRLLHAVGGQGRVGWEFRRRGYVAVVGPCVRVQGPVDSELLRVGRGGLT